MRFHFMRRLLASVGLALCLPAFATTYPLTVTDLSGQEVTIKTEPQRIIVQDGRDLLTLALLDRDNPFQRVVAWNNQLKRTDVSLWTTLEKTWPQAKNALDMKFNDSGEVNLEQVISKNPQLFIAELRAKPALEQSGVIRTLAKAGIPVVFLDLFDHPVKDAPASVALLGEVLNREPEAKAYTDFYAAHLAAIKQGIADAHQAGAKTPSVFIEAHAGATGANGCCFTHSNVGWGELVATAGGDNIGAHLFSTPTATVAMEKVLAENPDVYIFTGSKSTKNASIMIPFGYDVSANEIQKAFAALLARTGFSSLKAVQDGNVYGIYHQFYNHPYNIAAIEALAKDFYPQQFANVDPSKTYTEILTQFTKIPSQGLTLFAKAKTAQ